MPDLGPWEPWPLDRVVAAFDRAPFRWWISGGHALELHLGRSWRVHADTDVGILRADAPAAHAFLSTLDLHLAAAGVLSPWDGRPLDAAAHENNVWGREQPGGPWVLDLTIGDGDDDRWRYRRDPTIELPWADAVLHTDQGVPYLAPDAQLLYKSATPRPKDDLDAAEVLPTLDPRRRARLDAWLRRRGP